MTTNPHQRYQHWNTDDFAPISMAEYRRDMAEVREIEPSFGHYEPDLLYSESPWEAPKQPDPFYYQAQGQEPPQNGYQGGRWSFRTVVCCTLFLFAVGEIVLLVWGY